MADSNPVPAVDSGAVPTPGVDEQPGHKVRSVAHTDSFWNFSHLFQVFTGNLAYTTTDEGLKAFFSPVADDM